MSNTSLVSQSTKVMSTDVTISAHDNIAHVTLDSSIHEALNFFHKVVARFTRFDETSELSQLNKNQGTFFTVSEELFELITFGIELGKVTDGLFDITIIDLLEAYGYTSNYDFSRLTSKSLSEEISTLIKHRPSVFDIQFDFSKLAIKLAPKQRVDLGALGKGFAIRLARNHLLACGIENFLINAGGDIYAHGINQHNNLWTASLFDPNKSLTSSSYKDKGIVQLKNEALACSGGWARKVGAFHHLINPNTGDPIGTNKGQKVINSTEFNKTIYVKAKDPVIADAFATLCFLTPKIDTELLKKYSVTIL